MWGGERDRERKRERRERIEKTCFVWKGHLNSHPCPPSEGENIRGYQLWNVSILSRDTARVSWYEVESSRWTLFESPSATKQCCTPTPSGVLWSCRAGMDRVWQHWLKTSPSLPQLFWGAPPKVRCAKERALGNTDWVLNSKKRRKEL